MRERRIEVKMVIWVIGVYILIQLPITWKGFLLTLVLPYIGLVVSKVLYLLKNQTEPIHYGNLFNRRERWVMVGAVLFYAILRVIAPKTYFLMYIAGNLIILTMILTVLLNYAVAIDTHLIKYIKDRYNKRKSNSTNKEDDKT